MGAEQSRYDAVVHFEAALSEWATGIMQTHLTLANRLAEVRGELMAEFRGQIGSTDEVMEEVRSWS